MTLYNQARGDLRAIIEQHGDRLILSLIDIEVDQLVGRRIYPADKLEDAITYAERCL